ncbi:MAG: hypothetical protein PHN57_08135 [Candidatus Omnitrophica bacterium]|nr:hypothetical protein [Candidatus Omnitrophota bacterium]
MLIGCYKKRDKKHSSGQVVPFMILVVAVLILAIAGTMIIGETGFIRLRMANIADAAMISGASAFCRGLNQIRMSHTRMLLNYIQLQTAMLAVGIFPTKWQGYAAATGWGLIGIEQNMALLNQAKDVAKNMAKDLRTSVYDGTFGGALIDEPKPFIWFAGNAGYPEYPGLPVDTCDPANVTAENYLGEISRGGSGWSPRDPIIFINYDKYLKRDSHFTCEYRKLKRKEFPYDTMLGSEPWYKQDHFSYIFNKKLGHDGVDGFLAYPGVISIVDPPRLDTDASRQGNEFDSYVRAQLSSFPSDVSVDPQFMLIFFLYCAKLDPCVPAPGFIPHPYAWIRRVSFGSQNWGLNIQKKVPFTSLPFYGRDVDLEHNTKVRIRGSVWSGYDFQLQN